MKIVLREHVDHLGNRGDIVKVAAGFARNYLLPKGLALLATPGNMKQLENQRRVWAAKESKEIGEARALADRLAGVELSVTKKAGESGTLYGSVTNSELADLLLSQAKIEIDRRRIILGDPIKNVGSYEIAVKVHRDVPAKFKLEVRSQEVRKETVLNDRDSHDDDDRDEDFADER